jgi:Methyltransferase domain
MTRPFTPWGGVETLPQAAWDLAREFASGMMDGNELLHLAGALAAYPWEAGGIVVEIGAYEGRTTVFMARILRMLRRRVPILSIDPFEGAQPDQTNPQGHYAAYLENINREGVRDLCLPLVAFSQDAAPVVPREIGVLVIDGAHHYPVVSQDFALYGPKVLPRGLIFADDYSPVYPDVMRAADEYLGRESSFQRLHASYFLIAQRSA